MRVLFDTNVLMDYLAKREPYYGDAKQLFFACMNRRIEGFIAAHSVLNLFFILRHDYTVHQRRSMLSNMLSLFQIVGVDEEKILAALSDESFPDFEDCVQAQCAVSCNAQYVITRNLDDFSKSPVPAILPDEFYQMFLSGETENV